MSRGSRGRRYEEPKLNMKKVFAVILAIIVIIMVIFIIKGVLTKNKEQGKIASKDYFAAFKDNKWGVIDETGSVIIDPSYSEMIIVPNSKNDVFLCTYDVDYTTGTYKTKALNSKNEEIFKDYDKIEAIQNKDEKDNLWYEDDVLKDGEELKPGFFDDEDDFDLEDEDIDQDYREYEMRTQNSNPTIISNIELPPLSDGDNIQIELDENGNIKRIYKLPKDE